MPEHTDGEQAGFSLVDETLDEHRGCMQLVAEVEASLDRKVEDVRVWVEDLLGKLDHLEASLRQHFKGEEAGPMYRSLPDQHPRVAGKLAELEAEHPAMLQELQVILTKARGLEKPEAHELRELNGRTQLFIARIRRHEAAENELVLRTYWNDVGVGD
jgi:iron-sulfur cluster repair protein YtfE (RIC family)